ncbi:MAG: Hsp20/alpha crystallin family protein [archaeon]|nr:Hsp20/alpha crystallin family protein [archaeon]
MSLILQKLSKELMGEIGARSREMFELMLPAVDMFEDGSNLVIVLDMPGFAKEDIKTRLTEHYMVVNAKREPEEKDGMVYWEQRPLKVHKKIPLPVKVDVDEESDLIGKYENGVLTIKLPLKGVGKVRLE